jgi:hypothetical protein
VRRILLLLAGLTLLTVIIYWPVHRFPFVDYDDADYVFTNRFVHAGFTSATVHHAFVTFAMGNWNPLLWISFYADEAMFHTNPGPMHVENVLLHLIAGLLLWRLLFVATGSVNRSYFVAALFLVDPMHVESVAWISERKDVLSTPILLAAMLLYVRYCRQPRGSQKWIAYALMSVLFAASLMVKTMGVTLPAVLLLVDYWPLRRWPNRSWFHLVIEKIPLLAIAIAATIMGGIAQRQTGATASLAELGMLDRISNAIVCYAIYFVKLLVPVNLAVFYTHPGSRPVPTVFAAAVLLAMLTFFFHRIRRRYPAAIIGWLWFLGTLVPVIGLVQLGGQAMADRYSYFPSIGLFIALVWGVGDLLGRRSIKSFLAITVIVVFTVLARIQVSYWQNSETLFTHALSVDDSAVGHVVLAQIALKKTPEPDIHRAVDECNAALHHGPYARADFVLGNCWLKENPGRAGEYYRKAVEMEPQCVQFRTGLVSALRRTKHWEEAKMQAHEAMAQDPDDSGPRDELAKIEKRDSQ